MAVCATFGRRRFYSVSISRCAEKRPDPCNFLGFFRKKPKIGFKTGRASETKPEFRLKMDALSPATVLLFTRSVRSERCDDALTRLRDSRRAIVIGNCLAFKHVDQIGRFVFVRVFEQQKCSHRDQCL